MSSLDDTFKELVAKIKDPDSLNPAKSDPILYFVYAPEQMLEIKKAFTRWITQIGQTGMKVKRISMSDLLWQIIDSSGRWEDWLELEPEADQDQINESVRDVLRLENALAGKIRDGISKTKPDTIIFLTEAELLHPYFRTRIIESYLHDKVKTPVVIFYPGRRSGQYGLHFLNFYPVDGNYRSTIVGGER